MYKLSGVLKVKNDTQKVTDKFQKREFVVTDNSSNYPQDILFQLIQDRVDLLDPYNEGDQIHVNFFVRGREWTSPDGTVKYFNSLDVWSFDPPQQNQAADTSGEANEGGSDNSETFVDETEDDLPF